MSRIWQCIALVAALDAVVVFVGPLPTGALSQTFLAFGLSALWIGHGILALGALRRESEHMCPLVHQLTLPIAALLVVCAVTGSPRVAEVLVWPAMTATLIGVVVYRATVL